MIKWFEYFTVSSSELLECQEVQQNFKEESGKCQVHIPLSSYAFKMLILLDLL